MSTLICDYPNVVEAELFNYGLAAMPDMTVEIRPEPSRFRFVEQNAYLAGVDNLDDFAATSKLVFVRRSISDFFTRYIERMQLNGKLNAPFWADSFDARLPWIFECRESLVKEILRFWLDRERKLLPHGTTILNRTNFGPQKPIELLPGFSLAPAKPEKLQPEYSQALITLAQTL